MKTFDGHALQGDRESCLGAGMDDYLSKPFTRDALRAVLQRWLPVTSDSAMDAAPSRNQPRDSDFDGGAIDEMRALESDGHLVEKVAGMFFQDGRWLVIRIDQADRHRVGRVRCRRGCFGLAVRSSQIAGPSFVMRRANRASSQERKSRYSKVTDAPAKSVD